MKLHADINVFRDAITAASQSLGIREVFIEKDYWVTFVLWNLSKSKYKNRVVFKGGTSLSKAYDLIRRFSEDVDLALLLEGESSNQIKNLMKKVEKDLALDPLTSEPSHSLVSKGSKIRKTAYSYPRASNATDFGHASDRLILEINAFANPRPYKEMQLSSYIAQYLRDNDESLIKKFGLESFTVNVLDQKRTFTEKVIGLVRASYESNEAFDQIRSKVRHIYDLVKLLQTDEVSRFIKSDEFFDSIQEVQAEDRKNPEFQREWFDKPVSKAVLFVNTKEVLSKLESTLNEDFASLLFGDEKVPEKDEILRCFGLIAERLDLYEKSASS